MNALRFVALTAVFIIPLAALALIDKPTAQLAAGPLASSDAVSSRYTPTAANRLQ